MLENLADLSVTAGGVELVKETFDDDQLPEEIRDKVKELRKLHEQRVQQEKDFEAERVALLMKYQALEKPLWDERRRVLGAAEEGVACTNIENFWCQAMCNSSLLREAWITGDRDHEALGYLLDVRCNLMEDANSYAFEFEFAPNPFFEEKILTKTYVVDEDGEPGPGEGCDITWKAGKNLTVKIKKKKRGGKGRPAITKSEPCETCFNWFQTIQMPDSDEELDEDAAEEFQERFECDFDIGMCLKDKIIPHAVMWYTGEAEDSDEEDSDEESDEEDSDMDDDENDGAVQPVAIESSGAASAFPPQVPGTGGEDGQQQDCKQQ